MLKLDGLIDTGNPCLSAAVFVVGGGVMVLSWTTKRQHAPAAVIELSPNFRRVSACKPNNEGTKLQLGFPVETRYRGEVKGHKPMRFPKSSREVTERCLERKVSSSVQPFDERIIVQKNYLSQTESVRSI